MTQRASVLGALVVLSMSSPAAADVVLHGDEEIALGAQSSGADLWTTPDELARISGFALKPQGLCLEELCVPLPPAGDTKLITRDKVEFLMASCASSTTLALVPIHTRYEMINLNSCSSSKLITDPLPSGKPNPWIFRTQYRSDRTASFVTEFAAKDLGSKKIGVLNDTNEYGRAAAEGAMQHFKTLGMAAAAHETYNNGDKTFSAQLLKFKEAGVDTVAFFGYYQEAALILKQAKQLGLNLRMVTTDVLHSPVFLELAGNDANGVLVTTAFTKDSRDPKTVQFTEAYKKKFGKDPTGQSAMGYDAVYLMKWAYEKAGSRDKLKVRDALAKASGFVGVTGETKFNERGDDMRPFLVTVISNGKWIPYEEWKKGRR